MQKFLKWLIIVLSIILAVLIVRSNVVHVLVGIEGFQRITAIFAGALFTSVFTTAPAVAVLSELMKEIPVWQVAVLGGFGGVFGDLVIYHIIQRTVHHEARALIALPRLKRFRTIFKTKLFHRFLWVVGALIIASPLPDELGLALMGVSNIQTWKFLLVSFVLNAVGIALLATVVSSVML